MATMAHSSVRLASVLGMLFCICSLATLQPAAAKKMTPASGHLHLTFWSHEIMDGPNSTMLLAAGTWQPMNMSSIGWGSYFVFDAPLMTGAANNSKIVGHTTGTAVATSSKPVMTTGGLYTMADHIFDMSSKYNGSTLTVIGTIATAYQPYELLVLGGLGYFANCKGQANVVSVPATPPAKICQWDFWLNCH